MVDAPHGFSDERRCKARGGQRDASHGCWAGCAFTALPTEHGRRAIFPISRRQSDHVPKPAGHEHRCLARCRLVQHVSPPHQQHDQQQQQHAASIPTRVSSSLYRVSDEWCRVALESRGHTVMSQCPA